jgi:hypothetical protein
MATASRERVTVSLSSDALACLDNLKRQRRVSRSRALEILLAEWRKQEKCRAFAAEARVFFGKKSAEEREETGAFERVALEDWSRDED